MRYVVTGAAGFIGSLLAEALGARGDDVVGIDNFTDHYDQRLKEQNAERLDVRRLDLAVDELDFAGFDGVFHLAGQPGVRSFGSVFPLYVERNVLASQRVFEAAARDGVRVVFASSSSIYGEAERYPTPEDTPPSPVSPYGITKLTCEHLARAYARSFDLDAVVLRYFNAFGPRQRPDMAFMKVLHCLAAGKPFDLYGDGEQSRGWTYVDDVVEATILAMTGGSGTYNVGGGVEASLREAIGILEGFAGRSLEIREQPPVPGDQRRTNADTARIRAELGWAPKVSLEDGLRAQWEWASATSAPNEPRFRGRRLSSWRPSKRSTSGARPDDCRPLVAARRRRCARSVDRLPLLALGREDLQGDGAGVSRPAAGSRLGGRRHHVSDDARARPGVRHERRGGR